ncbi:DUF6098 family protein [Amycolatopsis acidiphila]|uniref:Uncharacterized protein n=1 Tax=Amycolatopsis acidiphila TaxID=715473 RepID=A0A558ADB3_9PSEU|nr:DUF6098 family protein [Amycolatopsis acidiphila]TVT22251.1 hypothetical protein FNH06_13775 [Amycolatopsis acidiphila]UIJ58039.1 DUF6098 family protein [Amycolatopsis acidiphila]
MRTLRTLDQLVEEFEAQDGRDLYVRWSLGPETDLADGKNAPQSSRDALTGMPLPGLSASPLKVEPWWDDRPLRLWLARRIYDYRHLRELRGPGVRPWVFQGTEIARGPDNEPLVVCDRLLAWVTDDVLREAQQLVDEQGSREWGPLDRSNAS